MKINPKMMEKAMKQLGIKSEELAAEEVIIKTTDRQIVITNPQVTRVNMGGQESFQVSGEISESPLKKFSDDDVKMVIEQTGATAGEAEKALEETGDIASAILKLRPR